MLSSFNQIVFNTAVVLFLIVMLIIGVAMSKFMKDIQYPPVEAQCPDYWEAHKDKDGTYCLNNMNLGNYNSDMCKKFDVAYYQGKDKLCDKYKLAQNCNLTWDGVTNNDKACKDN
jgi:hypothetical protein